MSFYASSSSQRTPNLNTHPSPDPDSSPASSPGAITPTTTHTESAAASSYLSNFLWGGFFRRFTSEPSPPSTGNSPPPPLRRAHTYQPDGEGHDDDMNLSSKSMDGVYTPPHFHHRVPSPMGVPQLEPLQLLGFSARTRIESRLLTPAIAEEVRNLVPTRLSIVDEWNLVYSLDQDGASLATLYDKCERYRGKRVGFVLAVRDTEGGLFGAYLSDVPHIAPNYFGTGECFLWRASVQAPLPPPPSLIDSEETPDVARSTTIKAEANGSLNQANVQSIRFKAFPYSGVNEYYMLCGQQFFSVGAGDGRFGLWLDSGLEKGVSSTCQTFGNEPLSDEGEKFGVLGVELWVIGA
ncbi:putative oxidation resistance protein 1 [Triangularia verruculosa]|uniref:Oxidation resistance protein 1 n=1 Tax=Triangularia verruculosa TaxID=2587418 RepID=A0AAN6X6U9_9PEZI|nr:putative oxidation resistance protein 1 [Triangularia verruculosa]